MKRATRRARRGFTLIELLVVVVIIGILASVALPAFTAAQDKSRIANLQSNLKNVGVALEQYGADNNGNYPVNGMEFDATTGLLRNGYLTGNQFPRGPWSSFVQAASVPVGAPMVAASALSGGTLLPAIGKHPASELGPGVVPTSTTFTATTFGAVSYDYDQTSSTYVLYGVGKDHGTAMLSAALSRAGNN